MGVPGKTVRVRIGLSQVPWCYPWSPPASRWGTLVPSAPPLIRTRRSPIRPSSCKLELAKGDRRVELREKTAPGAGSPGAVQGRKHGARPPRLLTSVGNYRTRALPPQALQEDPFKVPPVSAESSHRPIASHASRIAFALSRRLRPPPGAFSSRKSGSGLCERAEATAFGDP